MASTADENQRTPRVFISYSHDSAEHCDRVLMLAQRFRRDGIDAELDQFHQDELKHWPRWCEEQLRPEKSEWVLCICTPEYMHRVEGRVSADVGKGVFWEGTLIYNYLYDEKENRRFIPVFLDDNPGSDIPAILNGYTRFQITALSLDDPQSGYAKLYRLLTGQFTAQKAGLGELHKLPALSSRERVTDFTDLIDQILAGIIDVKSDTTKIQSGIEKIQSGIEKILKDRRPPPSTPKRPHNLPPWMSPAYFIGRDKELQALCGGLAAPGSAPAVVQPQVIIGGGGFGKSRLAIQAAWILYMQKKCDMAFYISAAGKLDAVLAALAEPSLLNLYDGQQPPPELDIRKQNVIAALREKAGRWILVLDAADSEKARDAVNELLSQLAGGRFLVTSRREDWPRSTVRKVPLDLFTIEEARTCLLSRYWKSEPPVEEIADFDRVATELGFLPLALVLAASYMESRSITPALYLNDWKQKHDTLLGFTAVDVEEGRSLLAAFKLSYDLLNPQAAHLLHMLAWLAPEPFPRRLVEDSEKMREMLSARIEGSAGSDPTKALAELRTLSLLQWDDQSLRLHRLVLKCARATLDDARADACAIALEWISSILPDAKYDETNWKLWNRLSPHLDEVIAAANELKIEGDVLAAILGKFGLWLFYQARYNPAEPLLRRSLSISEKSNGPEHPEVARDLNNLASLLQDTNRLEEAEPLLRRVVEIFEKSLGKNNPNVAVALNNLAELLRAANRLEEAEPLLRRSLSVSEKSYGPEDPKVAIPLSNLASLLQDTNRLEEAERLMRRVVEIFEKSLDKEHPNVAVALNNLAQLLQATNRLDEAEPLMLRALAIDEKSYGPEHPEVARDLNNLASLFQATNRLEEAEPLMRRDLIILLKFTRSTGHLHPHLKNAFGNYWSILEGMSLSEEEVARRIAEVGKEAGFDEQSYHALVAQLSK